MSGHKTGNPRTKNPFTNATAKFHELIEELSGEDMLGVEHGVVEELVQERGREVLRSLYQDHLLLRAPAEAVDGEVRGSDAEARRYRREGMPVPPTTLFGTVKVERRGYRGRDIGALTPLDASLNLPPNR